MMSKKSIFADDYYLRANMREYIKDKPVFNTASFAKDVEAMRMWSEFISRIPK